MDQNEVPPSVPCICLPAASTTALLLPWTYLVVLLGVSWQLFLDCAFLSSVVSCWGDLRSSPMVRWIASSGSSLGYAWSRGRNEIQTEKSMVTQAIREVYLSAPGPEREEPFLGITSKDVIKRIQARWTGKAGNRQVQMEGYGIAGRPLLAIMTEGYFIWSRGTGRGQYM